MKTADYQRPSYVASMSTFRPILVIVVALVFAGTMVLSACHSNEGPKSPGVQGKNSYALPAIQARQAAPDLNVTDIFGNKVALSQYRGKVVLLDFWAVDCGGCVIEIPWYVAFDKKYRDKGLQLLGIDMYGEAPSYIKPFMQKSQMQYPVAVGNDEIGNRFQAEELPKTILIDRQGRIAVSHVGIVDRDAFARDIEELLKEK